MIEYSILGPFTVSDGQRDLTPGAPKHRALLAALVLRPGQATPAHHLVTVVWGDEPPRSAESVLRVYVSALRRRLGADAIGTVPGGYRLDAAPDQVDALRFETLVAQARRAKEAGLVTEAAQRLHAALALWRGAALEGIDSDELSGPALRLAELRLAALEERIELDLAAGRHREVVPELRRLVTEHPLREKPWQQLMTALHRGGRRSEALEAYQRARRILVDELGLEPGAELRRTHAEILSAAPESATDRPRPRETPPDVADFTGRGPALAWITGAVTGVTDAPVHLVLYGAPGVGKSAVAVHAARRLADRFPDGQLYADLDVGGQRREPAAVLADLLRSLDAPHAPIPDDLPGRIRRLRTLLAGRRVLLLLDNAVDEAQVRPLLAPAPGCATLVTSRSPLAGLEGAAAYHLDILPESESVQLLRRLVGAERVAAEPEAAAEIARWCGGLPLALRIAGAKLARRPDWTLGYLAGRLAGDRRLDELTAGDLAVRGSLGIGYRDLSPPQQCLFRRLGRLSAPDFAPWVAAAMLQVPESEAERAIDALVEAGLLRPLGVDAAGQPRYRLHDLTRLYARERATLEEPDAAALAPYARRVLHLTRRSRELLVPQEPGTGDTEVHPGEPTLRIGAREIRESGAWLAAERALLVSSVLDLCQAGLAESAWRLAFYLAPFFESGAYHDDWRATHQPALAAARAVGDPRGVALMLRGLGDLDRLEGRPSASRQALRESLRLLVGLGDPAEEARTRLRLAWVDLADGHLSDAEAGFAGALAWFERSRDARGRADALRGLGTVHRHRSAPGQAVACLTRCVEEYRQLGDPRGQAATLRELGLAHQDGDALAPARECVERALALHQQLGDRWGEAATLLVRARADLAEGLVDAARSAAQAAARVCEEYGDAAGLATARSLLTQVHEAV